MSLNGFLTLRKAAIISLILGDLVFGFAQVQAQSSGKTRTDRPNTTAVQILQQPKSTDQVVTKNSDPPRGALPQGETLSVQPQLVPTGEPVKEEVKFGDFKFTATLPPGWSRLNEGDGLNRAQTALSGDGKVFPATFALSRPSGGIVYGTLQVLPDGDFYPASALMLRKEEMPPQWKAPPEALTSVLSVLKGGLPVEFSFSTIVSKGDGLIYDPRAVATTVGTWIAIPVTYKNSKGYQSVIVEFYSRALESTRAEAASILESIIDTVSLQAGALVSVGDYKAAYKVAQVSAKIPPNAVDNPTPNTSVTSFKEQSLGFTPTVILSSFATTNAFVLQTLFEKGSPFILSIRIDPKAGVAQFVGVNPATPSR